MAKILYEADGTVSAERFIAALTDFSDRRPELWPNLDTKFYRLHELGDTWAEVTEGTDVFGGIWARERYDWSEPGHVRLRLVESRISRRAPLSTTGRRRDPAEAAMSMSHPNGLRRACRVGSLG